MLLGICEMVQLSTSKHGLVFFLFIKYCYYSIYCIMSCKYLSHFCFLPQELTDLKHENTVALLHCHVSNSLLLY